MPTTVHTVSVIRRTPVQNWTSYCSRRRCAPRSGAADRLGGEVPASQRRNASSPRRVTAGSWTYPSATDVRHSKTADRSARHLPDICPQAECEHLLPQVVESVSVRGVRIFGYSG